MSNRLRPSLTFLFAVTAALLSAVLYQALLFPLTYQFNQMDEAIHVNFGRMLLQALAEQATPPLVPLAFNPLLMLFFSGVYAPLSKTEDWLLFTLWGGRALLFAAIWAGAYLVATSLRRVVEPVVMFALLALTPLVPHILQRSTDALYVALIGLMLWTLLAFQRDGSLRRLLFGGIVGGLAALARNDGIPLFLLFLVICCGLAAYPITAVRPAAVAIGRTLAIALAPFLLLVGSHHVITGTVTGNWDTGAGAISYNALVQGHGMAYSTSDEGYVTGCALAEEAYGNLSGEQRFCHYRRTTKPIRLPGASTASAPSSTRGGRSGLQPLRARAVGADARRDSALGAAA